MTPRAELLAFRRRLTEAAARRRPRALPRARPPSGAVVAYTRALRQVSDEMDAAILDALREEGFLRADAADDLPSMSIRHRRTLAARIESLVMRVIRRRPLIARLQEVADAVAGASRDVWARQVKAATGVDLPAEEPALGSIFAAFRKENLALITSLAQDKASRVRDILVDAGAGTRVEEIARSIRESTDATRSRANLIARDQVLKLNAQVTQTRHEAAGVSEYRWSTSNDERVRKSHKDLDGTRHAYDAPPVVDYRTGRRAHPGEDFQCRCIAEPIIPGFDD